jgi:predicted DNA-binding helix-hairpin-helix protein
MQDGMLDLSMDPKLAWALKHREMFPVDVNTAPRELLMRVPGLGTRAVDKIIVSRLSGKLRLDDVQRLTRSVTRSRPFLTALDWTPRDLDHANLKARLVKSPAQLALL